MTTFTNRSNAKRAAIKAGIAADQIEITVHKEKGKARFGFKAKDAAPVVDHSASNALIAAAIARDPELAAAATAKPAPKVLSGKVAAPREERNGVKRPAAGGLCAAVWAWLDANRDATAADVKAHAEKVGWNANNASIEFYGWRRFNGLTKPRVAKAKKAKAARAAERKEEGQAPTA